MASSTHTDNPFRIPSTEECFNALYNCAKEKNKKRILDILLSVSINIRIESDQTVAAKLVEENTPESKEAIAFLLKICPPSDRVALLRSLGMAYAQREDEKEVNRMLDLVKEPAEHLSLLKEVISAYTYVGCHTQAKRLLSLFAKNSGEWFKLIAEMALGYAMGKQVKNVEAILKFAKNPIEKFLLQQDIAYGYAAGNNIEEANQLLSSFTPHSAQWIIIGVNMLAAYARHNHLKPAIDLLHQLANGEAEKYIKFAGNLTHHLARGGHISCSTFESLFKNFPVFEQLAQTYDLTKPEAEMILKNLLFVNLCIGTLSAGNGNAMTSLIRFLNIAFVSPRLILDFLCEAIECCANMSHAHLSHLMLKSIEKINGLTLLLKKADLKKENMQGALLRGLARNGLISDAFHTLSSYLEREPSENKDNAKNTLLSYIFGGAGWSGSINTIKDIIMDHSKDPKSRSYSAHLVISGCTQYTGMVQEIDKLLPFMTNPQDRLETEKGIAADLKEIIRCEDTESVFFTLAAFNPILQPGLAKNLICSEIEDKEEKKEIKEIKDKKEKYDFMRFVPYTTQMYGSLLTSPVNYLYRAGKSTYPSIEQWVSISKKWTLRDGVTLSDNLINYISTFLAPFSESEAKDFSKKLTAQYGKLFAKKKIQALLVEAKTSGKSIIPAYRVLPLIKKIGKPFHSYESHSESKEQSPLNNLFSSSSPAKTAHFHPLLLGFLQKRAEILNAKEKKIFKFANK